ncbi:acetate/propionate family kinase [Loktanella sp. DJP18]|uniref:acetate/propionate family kinase n=1 Tax=Loktanella sp. DJP18 TaxID=3409788 RepID=UPI003BB52D17
MTEAVLTINAGSSSLKFALFPVQDDFPALLRGKVAGIGTAAAFAARDHDGQPVDQPMSVASDVSPDALITDLLRWLGRQMPDVDIVAVGHRVVHGGRHHDGPARVTTALMAELTDLVPLAPLHQPHNLAAIAQVARVLRHTPQVACFDTSFHRSQGPLAQMFALPASVTAAGVMRYGFHGLSYAYIADALTGLSPHAEGRVIVAHLGNGASMCALYKGRSVATSMGFTALDGLMMGQRCGALDPGVVLYLMDEMHLTSAQVGTMLYRESGLLGVSGISSDMAVLESSHAPLASLAIDMFCHRAAGELAALATANGGLDAIVFTAGIGENSARVRRLICARLAWLGVVLDGEANARHATQIGAADSAVAVMVIPTDEESVIANAARQWA